MTSSARSWPKTRTQLARVLAPQSHIDQHERQRALVAASLLTAPAANGHCRRDDGVRNARP